MEVQFLLLVISLFLFGQLSNVSSTNPEQSCPCQNPDWCKPIRDTTRKEVFAFSVSNDSSHWHKFDWNKLTTVVMVGYHSDELMCLAHALNTRVSYIAGIDIDFRDPVQRKRWIQKQLTFVMKNHVDGINFDYESVIEEGDEFSRDSYTSLVAETNQVMKNVLPYFQISVDVAWNMNADSRFYDYVGLANNSDFLFVMSYDIQSQIFGECVAMPNSGLIKTMDGLGGYFSMKISQDKLVLGVPWYGYIYPCVQTQGTKCFLEHFLYRGAPCSDVAGNQVPVSYTSWLAESVATVKRNSTSLTPYLSYSTRSSNYQVQYDDVQSLKRKYELAAKLNLRGVGVWTLDFVDYHSFGLANRKALFGALPQYKNPRLKSGNKNKVANYSVEFTSQ